MSDWTAGYMADIEYTFGYYSELNPLRMQLAFLHAGLVFPSVGTACELGFGQGVSANLHAAASVTAWHGTDFNPAQAAFAQEMAAAAQSGACWYDEAFAAFAARADLPDFDFIALHGIWSWISDENRAVIVDFVRRKLKVGGVLYISYNTLPGWAAFAPMRHLMAEHAQVIAAQGQGVLGRVNGALEFAEKLLATNPLYARANPQVVERVKKVRDQNRHYVAHEYFNRDWHPMHFATMADWLAPAKVGYACSAHYMDHVDGINLRSEQQAFLVGLPDPMFRESVRDFMVNQQFRRDYWVKGARRLDAFARVAALRQQKLMLVTHRPDVSLKVTGALGEASMSEAIYNPILDLLADHQPRTLGQIEEGVKGRDITFAQLVQAALVLVGTGTLAPVQDEAAIAQAKKRTDKLNTFLVNKARGNGDVPYLASPVTAGGVAVGRFQQLFLLAGAQGRKQPADMARFAWQFLAAQGQKIVRDGKTLETADDNLAELTERAEGFVAKQLPILKALRIA